jgi:hypothetical protein
MPPRPAASLPADGGSGSAAEAPHDKFRSPRISSNENLYWETNLGGSGEDIPERAYPLGGRLLIIGATTSDDLDFESEIPGKKIFLAVMSENGTPLGYLFYEGELIKSMYKPGGAEGVLVLFRKGAESHIMLLDENGGAVKTQKLSLAENESVIDAVYNADFSRIFLIVETRQSVPPKVRLKIHTLTENFEFFNGALLDHAFDLDYVSAYPFGTGLLVGANVEGQTSGALVLFEFDNRESSSQLLRVHECTVNGVKKYRAETLIPGADGGFTALIKAADGVMNILLIDAALGARNIVLLNSGAAEAGAIFAAANAYYVFTRSELKVGAMTRFNTGFTSPVSYDNFGFYNAVTAFGFSGANAFFGGKNMQSPVISRIDGGGVLTETAFGGKTESVIQMLLYPREGFLLALCSSGSKGADTGANFGGTDLWLTKIRTSY